MKKFFSVFIILLLISSTFTSFATSNNNNYQNEAEKLKSINVFKGSSTGFELNREPTRLEGAVMFVRLLGAEAKAIEKNYNHPFTDVPNWGSSYVGYLYELGLTNGISSTLFGTNDKIKAKSYMTFLLRSLNYSDQNGDFKWANALEKSKEVSIISDSMYKDLNNQVFLRDHIAKVSYDTLKTPMKNSKNTLAENLLSLGVFSKALANEIGILDNSISDTNISSNTSTSLNSIENILKNIPGVKNYKEVNGKRFYRPMTENELKNMNFDSLDTMDNYNNEYVISILKESYPDINWDNWLKIKWTKFDWNDNNHGKDLDKFDYWTDWDGNSPATAETYAKAMGLRLPTVDELKSLFKSLETGTQEDLGWPKGYFWSSEIYEGNNDVHRFVGSSNGMAEAYNDTRDYFVILVSDNLSSNLNSSVKNNIYPSSKKLKGMTDIKGVANSIVIDGVTIYRPLTTDEAVNLLGEKMYDYSVPGKYGYVIEKTSDYDVTLDEHKKNLKSKNQNIDWDSWLEISWPLYDYSSNPRDDGPGSKYSGNFKANIGDILTLYTNDSLDLTPKYLLDKLYKAYPNGEIETKFGWPINYNYITSSYDEFGNDYSLNLQYESSSIHIANYYNNYVSLIKYDDIIYSKLEEKSLLY